MRRLTATLLLLALAATGAHAQTALDRAAPDVIQQETPAAPTPKPQTLDPVLPDPPRAIANGTDRAVFVGAIRVTGSEVLRPSAFAAAIEPFVGRTLSRADRQALVDAVTTAARDRGLVLATASIEPQSVGAGVLRVRVDDGRIAAIRLTGQRHALVERMLEPIVREGPVTLGQLERRLLLASDVAGVILSRIRIVTEGSSNILLADIREDRLAAALSFDNWGTDSIGPLETQATVEARSVFTAGDEIGFVAAGTPLDPSEYLLGGVNYTIPVDRDGTTFALSGILARSEPGGRLARFDTVSDSASLRGMLRRPLLRRQGRSVWTSIGFGVRDLEQRQRGEPVRADRVTIATARLNGTLILPGTRVVGSLWVTRGLGLFGATREGDPLATRADGSGRFTAVELRGGVDTAIGGPFVLSVAGEGQVASRPLLVGDEIGLGGPRFGRGYDFRERSGDHGVAGSVELRMLVAERLGALTNVSPYLYADGGRVWNIRNGFGSGSLVSAGGGLRAGLGPAAAGIGLGFPLSGARDESGDRTPRLSFELFSRF